MIDAKGIRVKAGSNPVTGAMLTYRDDDRYNDDRYDDLSPWLRKQPLCGSGPLTRTRADRIA